MVGVHAVQSLHSIFLAYDVKKLETSCWLPPRKRENGGEVRVCVWLKNSNACVFMESVSWRVDENNDRHLLAEQTWRVAPRLLELDKITAYYIS